MIHKKPLSERLRPTDLQEIAGQDHLVSKTGFLSRLIHNASPLSLLFWGPPGSGKTTLAKIYGNAFDVDFKSYSAVSTSITDLKKLFEDRKNTPLLNRKLLLFIDEIHRFNKAQQDLFLPFMEKGSLILVGATTENPSFVLNNALLSRLRVLIVNPLDEAHMETILIRYEKNHQPLAIDTASRQYLIQSANGDGRYLLNMVENLEHSLLQEEKLTLEALQQLLQQRASLYDKQQDQHYNLISALHKSIRGSDPDAALYWLARMLEGGEDPLFIARRLIRTASEDIGLADPNALTMTLDARKAYHILGSPEGDLALAQATVYLALAPKSCAVYEGFKKAVTAAKTTGSYAPPHHILNAPTPLMKQIGYGKEYQYDHHTEHHFSAQNYFPKKMQREKYYSPRNVGFEREMFKRVEYFEKLRQKIHATTND